MAYCGRWGTFIHIPKTGGNWVNRVIRTKFGSGKNDGVGHGLPWNWDSPPFFTCYRDPAKWLRSTWGHRRDNGWKPYPHNDVPWATFINMTQKYRSDDFEEYGMNVIMNFPGIISWFFELHAPPNTFVFSLEHPWLLGELGCDISLPPANTNKNGLPEISEGIEAACDIFEKTAKNRIANWKYEWQRFRMDWEVVDGVPGKK